MGYKELFVKAWCIISSPAKAWEEIRVEEDRQKVMSTYVYPMLALCSISWFVGVLWKEGMNPLGFQKALTECCAILVSLFGGYFVASYAINKIGVDKFNLPDNLSMSRQLTGYAFTILFFTYFIVGLFPGFFILGILFQFYLLYVVWEGSHILIKIEENKQMPYTIISSLLIIGAPLLLKLIFKVIMSGLN